jgi:hypothetical protein
MAGHCIDEARAQEDKKRLLLERFQLEVRCSLQPYGMYAHTHICIHANTVPWALSMAVPWPTELVYVTC